jgi:hypothetical protein
VGAAAAAAAAVAAAGEQEVEPQPVRVPESEAGLDRVGFDAQAYVRDLLGREGLEGLLAVEAGLVTGEWG